MGIKINIMRAVSVEIESNKRATINDVLYSFWKSFNVSKSGLNINRIISNHYVYAREFCGGFQKKLLE